MYQYRVLKIEKEGRSNVYHLLNLQTQKMEKMKLKELISYLQANQVINAIYKGSKVIEIEDAFNSVNRLQSFLAGNLFIRANVARTAYSRTTFYIKFYNQAGDTDITNLVHSILQRYFKLSDKREIVVSAVGVDIVNYLIRLIIEEAHKCGVNSLDGLSLQF